ADRADPAGRARRIAERAHRRDRLPLRDPPTPAGEGMSGSPSLPTPESTPVPTASRRSALRPLTALAVPALLLLAVLAALLGMAATGALRPATLVPASPLVTFGLPVVRVLHHLGLLLTIGAGGTVVLHMPRAALRDLSTSDPARRRSDRLAAARTPRLPIASVASYHSRLL